MKKKERKEMLPGQMLYSICWYSCLQYNYIMWFKNGLLMTWIKLLQKLAMDCYGSQLKQLADLLKDEETDSDEDKVCSLFTWNFL